jgi:pilus assembly protein Flp/PilA
MRGRDAASRRDSQNNLRRRRTIASLNERCTSSGEDFTMSIINFVKNFAREEEGQDLLEYALLVALIALIAIGAVGAAGVKVDAIFDKIATDLPVSGS